MPVSNFARAEMVDFDTLDGNNARTDSIGGILVSHKGFRKEFSVVCQVTIEMTTILEP